MKGHRRSRVIDLYSFFNLGAGCGGWSTPRPGLFTPGKTLYPLIVKAITLQAWERREGSRSLMLLDFKTISTCRW